MGDKAYFVAHIFMPMARRIRLLKSYLLMNKLEQEKLS